MGNKYLDGTALTIAIIGAINWGLIGLFRFDLVAFIFGDMSPVLSINKIPIYKYKYTENKIIQIHKTV